jgi:hypothetical protein
VCSDLKLGCLVSVLGVDLGESFVCGGLGLSCSVAPFAFTKCSVVAGDAGCFYPELAVISNFYLARLNSSPQQGNHE